MLGYSSQQLKENEQHQESQCNRCEEINPERPVGYEFEHVNNLVVIHGKKLLVLLNETFIQ